MYQPASSATYYFHYNAHGDVVALTDSSAKVVATYNYDPWGKVTNEWYDGGVTIRNPFRYGGAYGYYYDSETGMYYLRARYYKPDIYRFISKDPVQGDLRDPMSLNLYTYCGDNPVNAVDPDGLCVSYLTGKYYREINVRYVGFNYGPWKPWFNIKRSFTGWGGIKTNLTVALSRRVYDLYKYYNILVTVYKHGELIHRMVLSKDYSKYMGKSTQVMAKFKLYDSFKGIKTPEFMNGNWTLISPPGSSYEDFLKRL